MSVTIVLSIPKEVPEWCDLFNHPDFYNIHKTDHSLYFSFFQEEKLIGLIHLVKREDNKFRSPSKGTYGNFNFKENVDLQIKSECVSLLLNYLIDISAKKIEIVSAPFAHDLNQATAIFNAFINHSFIVSNQEINHSLIVDSESMIEKMQRNNKKRLNKCIREGFEFSQVQDFKEIEEVYQVIQENRIKKGYEVSMTLTQIIEMYKVFPNRLFFFKASQNGVCSASSICIELNKNVLYVFYWGDKPGFEQYSPVVFLADGIYNFAYNRNYRLLDVGTSSIDGNPNYGVARFKENLGFNLSPKLIYLRTYE